MFSVGGMRIRHFRRFRQNGPFLAGDKNTVYQKHGLCDPDFFFFKCRFGRSSAGFAHLSAGLGDLSAGFAGKR